MEEQELLKLAEASPAPQLVPVQVKPTTSNRVVLLEDRVERLERAIREGFTQLQGQLAAAPRTETKPAERNPLMEMAAAWQVFSQIQTGAQQQVQQNYAFMKQLAQDVASGDAPQADSMGELVRALAPVILENIKPAQKALPPAPEPPTPKTEEAPPLPEAKP